MLTGGAIVGVVQQRYLRCDTEGHEVSQRRFVVVGVPHVLLRHGGGCCTGGWRLPALRVAVPPSHTRGYHRCAPEGLPPVLNEGVTNGVQKSVYQRG